MKRAGVTYAELAKQLEAHGLQEAEASITNKFARGTFAATFLLTVLGRVDRFNQHQPARKTDDG